MYVYMYVSVLQYHSHLQLSVHWLLQGEWKIGYELLEKGLETFGD